MTRPRLFLFPAIAAGCFCALLVLDRLQPKLLVQLRQQERDMVERFGRTTPANPDLVFMAIDSDSVTLDASMDVKDLYGLADGHSVEARALVDEQIVALAA